MTGDAKHMALHYLSPVYRFENRLEAAGFRITHERQVDDGDVWELEMECGPDVGCRTGSEITTRLREIAEQAQCPIPPGRLVAIMSRRKVVAGFVAPPVGVRM